MTRRWLLLWLLPLFFVACFAGPSDRKQEVHDLRVLAMRLDPPEIEVPIDEAAPPLEVRATALVIDPARGDLSLAFQGCPDPGRAGCQDSLADPADPLLAGLLTPRQETLTLPASGAPETRAIERRSFSVATMNALFEEADLAGLAGVRPVLELRAFAPDDPGHYEVATKRYQISYPDALYRFLLGEVGVPICDATGQPAGCLDYRTRVANRNPVITSLAWQGMTAAENGDQPVPVPGPGPDAGIEVAPGTTVRIYPLIDPDSPEAYQTLGIDLENEKIVINDYEELLVLNWFSTGGELALSQTVPERDFGAFDDFTAPDDIREPTDLWIWIVLRDNRGGVDFRTLRVRVTP